MMTTTATIQLAVLDTLSFEVAKEVKLCLSCHDPKYTWKFKDSVHMKDCVVKKGKKTKFSCRNEERGS